MRIILTETELATALRAHYPVPADYQIEDVAISKYGRDFCTISLEKVEPVPMPEDAVRNVEIAQVELRA